MFKLFLKLIIFVLLCYVVVEQTYRFYAAGPKAFHPAKFNSMNMLLQTGLVRESKFPEIYYELKPNLDDWFQGVKLRTNSVGLADKEYSREKPDNTFRVAVIGSSWTMPTGVLLEDSFHSVLEENLNEQADKTNIEFINFAVEYYGLREQVATARERAMTWDPDLFIFSITSFTASLEWTDASENKPLPEQTNPVFSSYSLRELDRLLKTNLIKRGLTSRPVLTHGPGFKDVFNGQLQRAVESMAEIAAEREIPVVIMWLANYSPGPDTVEFMQKITNENNMLFVDAYTVLSQSHGGNQISRFDRHPDASGHLLIANYLKQLMQEQGLLPDK